MSGFAELQNRVSRFFRREARATSNSPHDPIWTNLFAWNKSKAGALVTPDNALQVSSVFACIRVLAETMASLPLKIYRRTTEGKETDSDYWLYPILHDITNPYQSSYEFRETLMTHMSLRGNFYGLKQFNGSGKLAAIHPLDPGRMAVKMENGKISYEYTDDIGKIFVYTPNEIWHVKGLSTNGLVGLSPVSIARESIGLAIATEEHGARVFSNYANPGGILSHPGKLKEDTSKRLKKQWTDAHAGGANAHKVAVLEEGMTWTRVSFSNDDSQFLETRNFQVEDIARIFRVPSVLIGHPDKTMTYASAEQFFLSFVVHTIRPWAARIEQSINMHLIPEKDRKTHFAEFQLDGLLRGDLKSRYEAYAIARTNRWMSANEIREKENMNAIEGGDTFENPNISTAKPDAEMNEAETV